MKRDPRLLKKIILITGERQVGKSTLCRKLASQLQTREIPVSGMLTRATGPHHLEATDLLTSERYTLTRPFRGAGGFLMTHFRLDPEALTRSAAALEEAFPTQIFLLDELGPLELRFQRGWNNVPRLLARHDYCIALVVVRPSLLVEAMYALPSPVYCIVEVTPENRDLLLASLLLVATELCVPGGEGADEASFSNEGDLL